MVPYEDNIHTIRTIHVQNVIQQEIAYTVSYLVGCCCCPSHINPFRALVPFRRQTTQISSSVSLKRDYGFKGVIPFRTTVPFWGQTSQVLSICAPKTGLAAVLNGL